MPAKLISNGELIYRFTQQASWDAIFVKQQLEVLREQLKPKGFVLFRCELLDSSRVGHVIILPYGENCTLKLVPEMPIQLDGLASATYVAVAYTEEANYEQHQNS